MEERLEFYDKGVAPRKNVDVMKEVMENLEKKGMISNTISLWHCLFVSLLYLMAVCSLFIDEGEVKAVEGSEKKKKKEKRKAEEKDEEVEEEEEKSKKKKKKSKVVEEEVTTDNGNSKKKKKKKTKSQDVE